MEEAIKTLGIPRTVFVRPSLLMGNRNEFRLGEEIAKTMAGLMNLILFGSLKKYRPIDASKVATAMITVANTETPDSIYESDKLDLLSQ
ncbi:MAG: hypothetical protein HC905_08125 [Bacteroidales bacterium]|nr:hypothetical protein [Bacteroidales bacterium]